MQNKQTKQKNNATLWGVIVFLLLVAIDQITKIIADAYMDKGDSIAIIDGWLWITFTYNRGISYGMGSDTSPILKLGVIVSTAVIMAVLAVLFFKMDKRRVWLRIAFVFVVAGGVGNLIDRVYYRVWDPSTFPYGVRDMVDLSRFGFAVCNFADFFISAGAVMLVLGFMFFDQDAMFPQGKYKALAKEWEEREEEKEENKRLAKENAENAKNAETTQESQASENEKLQDLQEEQKDTPNG